MAVPQRTALGLAIALALVLPLAHAQAPTPAQHPMPNHQTIHDAAVAEVLRFYAPLGNAIDASHWRVSIEDFEWQDAVYRIDVAVDESPTLLPWKSAYVMAHRIWMTAAGRAIKTEPIYDRPNLADGERTDDLPANRRGFYPGNRHFAAQLAFLHTALIAAGTVELAIDRPAPGLSRHYTFPLGTQDLAHGRAEVMETANDYRVQMAPPQEAAGSGLGPGYQLRFRVHKNSGKISDLQLILLTPPALM
jgi:hypothetical protein